MQNKYKYLIFDLDGTLLDTDLYVVSNYAHLFLKYKPHEMKRLDDMIYYSGPTLDEIFEREFPNISKEKLFEDFVEYSLKYSNSLSTMYNGERECLDELLRLGYKMSVCTSKRVDAVLNNFKHFDMNKYFDYIIGFDSVTKHKPDPECILNCIEKYGCETDEVLYIGDSYSDIIASHRAHVDCMLVNWGLKKIDLECKPTYIVESYDEIRKMLCK